jgi:hypothetical protein
MEIRLGKNAVGKGVVVRAQEFRGYEGLKLVDLPKPVVTDGNVLVRMSAGGVTPLRKGADDECGRH